MFEDLVISMMRKVDTLEVRTDEVFRYKYFRLGKYSFQEYFDGVRVVARDGSFDGIFTDRDRLFSVVACLKF